MRVARIARDVARRVDLDDRSVNEAFTAGLLHDVGKLVLLEAIPDYHARLAAARADLPEADEVGAEHQAFGASHAEVGSYLFGLWGLPYGIVEAVAWHHRPREGAMTGRGPVTAVHAANAIDHATHPEAQPSAALDDQYLADLGLLHAYPGWQTFAQERAAA